MPRISPILAALILFLGVAAYPASGASAPASATISTCGAVSGPTAHINNLKLTHYVVAVKGTGCPFAKTWVSTIVRRHLPNTQSPSRVQGPAGWVCVAEEVDGHIPVTGHCVKGRAAGFGWVPGR